MAQIDFGGLRKEVCLAYIPDVQIGEYVIVHVGFAIQRLDERSAQETLANFERLGILERPAGRLAFSTGSFVVKPMFFPGGSIGDLAVNGTVNDLAMSGATPLYLSTAFILAEGTALTDIARVAMAVGKAAEVAGVQLDTGDTKVVDSGSGDGIYINTAGIGVIPDGIDIGPTRARVGDAVLVSGDIGVHGVAVMSCREGIGFGTSIESDTAPLHSLVAEILATGADVKVLRDPTRGGVSATLNEIAKASGAGLEVVERDLPIPPEVRDACGLLGLDPLQVANEGKLVAIVPADCADEVLATMRSHPLGVGACRPCGSRATPTHPTRWAAVARSAPAAGSAPGW